MQKMLNPNTTLWVVDAADVVNPFAPTVTNLNTDGINISCAITRGYTLNPTDSDTDDTASICDTGNTKTRLFDNYEGELTAFKEANNADSTSVYLVTFNYFKNPDVQFWVYRRLGKKNTVVASVGDTVEGFLFTNDRLRSVDGADTGPIQFTVPLLPQGQYTGYTYVGTVAAPTVTAVSPATSGITGGATLTLTGTNINSISGAKVGGVFVPATITSATTATLKIPAHAAGTVNVQVVNDLGTSATGAGNQLVYS